MTLDLGKVAQGLRGLGVVVVPATKEPVVAGRRAKEALVMGDKEVLKVGIAVGLVLGLLLLGVTHFLTT